MPFDKRVVWAVTAASVTFGVVNLVRHIAEGKWLEFNSNHLPDALVLAGVLALFVIPSIVIKRPPWREAVIVVATLSAIATTLMFDGAVIDNVYLGWAGVWFFTQRPPRQRKRKYFVKKNAAVERVWGS